MYYFKHIRFQLAGLLLILFICLSACSTKKNTFSRRAYHNVVAHYNAYFNGNESLKEGVAELAKAHEDNYNEVLQVFKLGNVQQAQSNAPKMDRAIEKATKVIRKHSMNFKGVEYVKWISRSYLLIGKANFYKREYELAAETFEYVLRLYSNDLVRNDAMLQSAKTNNIKGNFGKSASMLEQLTQAIENGELKKKQINEYHLIYADYYIKQDLFDDAPIHIESALKTARKKKDKVRLNFILGQLYQKKGDLQAASKAYNRVIRMNPPYELEFNAKINAAMCYDATKSQSKNLVELLTKMLKDDKNKDYLDQIYFALAQIAIKDKNTDKAIEYLKLSAEKSVSNDRQKGVSFYTLAELYYQIPDYIHAQIYYDSCVTVLPKDFKDFQNIEKKQKILSELVKNILTVELEDSLQKLAGMSEQQRISIVDKIIEDLKAEEQRKQKEEAEKQQNMFLQAQNQNPNMQMQQGGGGWYFYNPSAMSYGYSEFVRKWGNRKLEDNWRLSNKEMVVDFNEDTLAEGTSESDSLGGKGKKANDPKDRNTYLKNIPLTAEMVAASNEKIMNALYNLGVIYKENLQEYKLSNDAFEKLISRFPASKLILNTYYYLFRTYDFLKDKNKSDYYKNLILSKYPDSEHAKIINDPDYIQKKSKQQSEAEIFYSDVYNDYLSKNFTAAIQKADDGIKRFASSATEAKFAYIKTLCIGKTEPKEKFEKALNDFIAVYGKTPLAPLAQNMLDYLQGKMEAPVDAKALPPGIQQEMYKVNDSTIHFYIMIVDAKKVKVNDFKNKISDYNSEFHRLLNLTISNVFLDETYQIVTVTNFNDKATAMKYYDAIKDNKKVFEGFDKSNFRQFVISVENYPIFYKDKNVDKYMEFFKKKYL